MNTTIAGLCFTDSSGVAFTHDWRLAGLSFLIASAGSYSALGLAERLREKRGRQAIWWHAGSALTLGGSVWSMHFLGMLAIEIDVPLRYAPLGTGLSALVAIVSVWVGLGLARNGALGWPRLACSGFVIGLGVAAMHYIGMAALTVPGSIAYTIGLWCASVLIAMLAATVSLWLALKLRPDWRLRSVAAMVMGVAICGMHYTGMASTVFFDTHPAGRNLHGIASGPLAASIVAVMLGVLLVGLVAASVDRELTRDREQAASAS